MSSVAWSTAVVLLLLTPGLLALFGLYLPMRVSRDVVPQTGLSQLAYLICVSALIHAPVLLVIRLLASAGFGAHVDFLQLFAILDVGFARAQPPAGLVASLYENLGLISLYFLATGALGMLVGYSIGRLIIAGPLRSLALHGWVYELQSTEAAGITFAYVLTTVQDGKYVLMYKGVLDQLHIGPDGAISYLTIEQSSRYYLLLEGNSPLTTADDLHALVGVAAARQPSGTSRQFLLIEGENIANVVFETYEIDPASIPKLEEAVRAVDTEIANDPATPATLTP